VAEADKAGREDMEQEAVEKSMGVHGHLFQGISGPPVAVGEVDVAIADVDQAGIRQSDAMRITTEIVDDLGGAGEGGFGIHDPRRGGEVVEELRKALGGGEGRRSGGEGKGGGRVGTLQGLEELGPEDGP
jgi:hypothetical protein